MRKLYLIFISLLFSTVAFAGSWNLSNGPSGAPIIRPGGNGQTAAAVFTWSGSDSGDQPAIDATQCGELSFTAEVVSGTPSVGFYSVATASTATASGTQVAIVTGTGRTPAYVLTGAYFLRPNVATAAGGGTVNVRCAGYANRGVGAAAQLAGFSGLTPTGSTTVGAWCPGGNVYVIYAPNYTFPYQAGAYACRITSNAGGVSLWSVQIVFDRDLLPAANAGFEARIEPALQAATDFCLGPTAASGFDVNQEHKCEIDVVTDTYLAGDTVFIQSSTAKAVSSFTIDGHGSLLLHSPSNLTGGTAGYESSVAIASLPATWSRGNWWILTDSLNPDDISTGGKASKTIGTIVPDAGTCNQQWGTPTIRVDTTAAHNLSDGSTLQRLGDLIEITGTTNYNGVEYVRQVIDVDTFCYVQNNSTGSGTENAGTIAPMKNAAFATGPNTTTGSRVSGGPPFFVIGGDASQVTSNIVVKNFVLNFSTNIDTGNNEQPWRQRGILVVGNGGGAWNIRIDNVPCTVSNEMGQTCIEVNGAGGGSGVRNVYISNTYLDSGPDFGVGTVRIRNNASHVVLMNDKGGHGGGRLDIGDDTASVGDAFPTDVLAFGYTTEGCGTYCIKMSGGQLTLIGAWIQGDVDGPGSAGARKVDPGFFGWLGGATNTDADFHCYACELNVSAESNLTTAAPYFLLGNARRIEFNSGYLNTGNDAGARIFGAGFSGLNIQKLVLDFNAVNGSGTLIDYTNFTATNVDHPLHQEWFQKTPATNDAVSILRLGRHSHLGPLNCVAQGGAGSNFTVTLNECTSSVGGCAGVGLTAALTALNTLVTDSSSTDSDIAAGNTIQASLGTVTTAPTFYSCSLDYRTDF